MVGRTPQWYRPMHLLALAHVPLERAQMQDKLGSRLDPLGARQCDTPSKPSRPRGSGSTAAERHALLADATPVPLHGRRPSPSCKVVRRGMPFSPRGNRCVGAPGTTGWVRRPTDSPPRCRTKRACHQNRKWCKISETSCMGSRAASRGWAATGRSSTRPLVGREGGGPCPPQTRSPWLRFVEPES